MKKLEYIKETFDNFIGFDVTNKVFDECVFSSCDFSSLDFANSKFIDCKFVNCNFSLVKLSGVKFQNVNFEGCKFLGVNFGEIDDFLVKVRFNECLIKDSFFSEIKILKTGFISCEVFDCEFSGVELSFSDFSGSDFKNSYFRKCNLSNCNFLTSKNYSIDPTSNEISGSKFKIPEILGLLENFDIEIE